MPLCTLNLLQLSVPLPQFLSAVQKERKTLQPLTVAKVIRWIITPSTLPSILNTKWDVLLILPSTTALPQSLTDLISKKWTVTAGVPSSIIKDFDSKNKTLLQPSGKTPDLTGSLDKPLVADSAQNLQLSKELQSWLASSAATTEVPGAVSMYNLLSFKPGMKDSYLKYGAAFAKTIGAKRGGNAKIVGTVVDVEGAEKKKEWDEVALAHYPTLQHFADMLASEDYQEVNLRYRVPALRDTFILCTSELGLPWPEQGKL